MEFHSEDIETTYCFESPTMARIFNGYHGNPGQAICTLDDILGLLGGVPLCSSEERLHQFRELMESREREQPEQKQREREQPEQKQREREQAEHYLLTIEILREAMILSHDDVEFCFSCLPPSPKNSFLCKLMHRYLDSKLSHDRSASFSTIMEQFKASSVSLASPNRWIFVKSAEPSFLFSELAKSFIYARGIEQMELREFWEILKPIPLNLPPKDEYLTYTVKYGNRGAKTTYKPLWLSGPSPLVLLKLAERVLNLLDRGHPPEKTVIWFSGERNHFEFLNCFFQRRSVPLSDWVFSDVPLLAHNPISIRAHLISSLRTEYSLELTERLKLSELILKTLTGRETEEQALGLLQRSFNKHRIPSERSELVRALLTSFCRKMPVFGHFATETCPEARSAEESPSNDLGHLGEILRFAQNTSLPRNFVSRQRLTNPVLKDVPLQVRSPESAVQFLPLTCFSPLFTPVMGFVDNTFLSFPKSPLLLKEAELEELNRNGFPIPDSASHRKRRQEILEAFLSPPNSRPLLFSPDSLSPVRLGTRRNSVKHCQVTKSLPLQSQTPSPFSKESTDLKPRSLPPLSLSATQLEIYAHCPAKYLFSNCLRLKLKDFKAQYPLLLGQLVHLTLENFFKSQPSISDILSKESFSEWTKREFERLLPELSSHLNLDRCTLRFLQHDYVSLISKVPTLENLLESLSPCHQPLVFERDFEIEVGGFLVRGKIDRIDQQRDGSILILDYKTGKVDFSPNHIEQGNHFQALLYILAAQKLFDQPCAGILFYDLREGEIRRGLLQEEHFPAEVKKQITRGHMLSEEKLFSLKESGISHLKTLAEQIKNSHFPPQPSPSACMSCEFAALCREGYGYA